MKEYIVYVDITYSVSVSVKAEDEEQVMNLAEEKIVREPLFLVKQGAIANVSAYDYDVESAK